ncbi:MAG TPA: chaperone modulator CbpM [Paralcaligenes sp.]|jgi:chaperone modulatory protein CbpM
MTTVHITESIWLNASDICSFDHLLETSGLTRSDLLDLVEAGIIEPSNQDPDDYLFSSNCIVIARTARRLRDDFELESRGLALALNLIRRADRLEAELAELRARFLQEKKTT